MTRLFYTTFVCLALLLPIGCSKDKQPATTVQEAGSPSLGLMKIVPQDVIAFVAGAGCDNIGPAFEKSIPGRIWKEPEVQTFVQTITEQLMAKLHEEVPDANQTKVPSMLLNFAKLVVKRPIVAGAASKKSEDGPPMYGFLMLDAGTRKAEIAAAIDQLEALDKEGHIKEIEVASLKMHGPADSGGVPGYWGWIDNYFVLAVNDGEGLAVKHLRQPRTAAPDNISKVPTANDIFSAYLDCRRAADVVEIVAEQESATDMLALVSTVLDTLGLKNVRTMTASASFQGQNLLFTESVETPQPRTGLLASLKTVNLKMLDLVDARALSAGVVNCDTAVIYDTIMSAIKAAAPPHISAEIDNAIAQFQSQIQVDIRKDILGSLAGPALFYSLPGGAVVEAPGGGFVAIADLKDAPAMEKSIASLVKLAGAMGGASVKISSQPQDNGNTLYTCVIAPLAMMQIMPCWMITDDKMLIASNPALHKLALARLTSPKSAPKSIRTVEAFKKATANLPANMTFFSYTDSRVQFRQMMLTLQGIWPMANMFAAGAGLKLPPMLPSLTEIIEDIEPSVQYSWFDEKGLHSIYRGSGIEPTLGVAAGAGIGAAVAFPALARTRQIAKRMQSATNLSGIGKACLIYANDYDDKFPPNLEELIQKVELSPKSLESKSKPKDFDGPSFIYIAGQTTSNDPGNIVAYENPAFLSEGTNVLFLDCHVEWMRPDDFLRELEETYKRLGKEMPEVKFKEPKSGASPFPFLR